MIAEGVRRLKLFAYGDLPGVALIALDAPAGIVHEDDLDDSSAWAHMSQHTALRTLARRGIVKHMPSRSENNWQLKESWRVVDRRRLEKIARG